MRFPSAVRLVAVVLMACALPAVALASNARVEGLGLQNDYVMDRTNVLTYPSSLVRHQNLVFGELGVKDADGGDLSDFEDNDENPRLENADRGFGTHLGNLWGGQLGVLGVYINENAVPLSPALGAQYFNRNANEAWNVLWGYQFQNLALGLEFNRSFSKAEDSDEVVEPFTGPGPAIGVANNARQLFNAVASGLGADDWNSLGFGGGVSIDWDAAGYSHFVDLSAEIRSYAFEFSDATAGEAFEDDNSASIAFNARAHLQTAENLHLVPVFNFYRLDLGTMATRPGETVSFENDVTGINAGIAGQWNLREDDWLYLGLGFQNVSMDFQDFNLAGRDSVDDGALEVEYTVLPELFGALESNLFSWLTLRLGASKPLYSKLTVTDKTVAPFEETDLKDSPLKYSVGLGFHLGKVDVDAVLNQDFPFTGGWLASGTSEVPFTRLSATYRY